MRGRHVLRLGVCCDVKLLNVAPRVAFTAFIVGRVQLRVQRFYNDPNGISFATIVKRHNFNTGSGPNSFQYELNRRVPQIMIYFIYLPTYHLHCRKSWRPKHT